MDLSHISIGVCLKLSKLQPWADVSYTLP